MIYQTTYIGTGTILDPFRPDGSDGTPAWTSIDLRDDPTAIDGECLFQVDDDAAPALKLATLTQEQSVSIVRERLGLKQICLGNRLVYSEPEPAPNGTLDPSDDFARADATELGANWDLVGNLKKMQIVGGAVRSMATGEHAAEYWVPNTPASDQWSEIVLKTRPSGGNEAVSATVRADTVSGGFSFYYNQANNAASKIWKVLSGSYTQIASGGGTPTAGMTIRMRAVGTTISLNHNSVQQLSVTDTSRSSGRWGMAIYLDSAPANGEIESWQGGDEGAVVGQPAVKRFGGIPHMRQGQHSIW